MPCHAKPFLALPSHTMPCLDTASLRRVEFGENQTDPLPPD
ncbi:hypothetical protein BN9982_2080005 [Mycobacterium tuberculosis]|nr:hypothetical protein BN9982_2080005 [Mycobacterium tuberculosis]